LGHGRGARAWREMHLTHFSFFLPQPCVSEHVVVESRPDNRVDDLR